MTALAPDHISITEDPDGGTVTVHTSDGRSFVTHRTYLSAFLRIYHPDVVARFFGRLTKCPGCGWKVRGQHYCD